MTRMVICHLIPKIGQKVRFIPAANLDHSASFPDVLRVKVEGTVVQICEARRWFRVEYEIPNKPGCIGHETFKY